MLMDVIHFGGTLRFDPNVAPADLWFKRGGPQRPGSPQHNSEHAIHAVCGRPDFINTRDFPTCFEGVRREHSRKPDEFYDRLRRVTRGPRVDVFSREERDGFAQFGNETDKFPRPLESTNRSPQQRTVDAAQPLALRAGSETPRSVECGISSKRYKIDSALLQDGGNIFAGGQR
jgi:hypothetical protein